MKIWKLCGLVPLIAMVAGCYNMRSPGPGPQGTVYQQRNDAVLHDPFPDNVAGPEIKGARPWGYEMPLSEPTNIQSSPFANQRRLPY